MSFEYPEIYHLPPFFTLQPVEETRVKQLKMWTELIQKYCQFHKLSLLQLDSLDDAKSPASAARLFGNPSIKRKLSLDSVRIVLDNMVSEGFASWQDDSKVGIVVSWKRFPEWASTLHEWARSNYQIGKICTLYELSAGDLSRGAEFHGVDVMVLLHAVKILEKQGKASLILADNPDETGIKFI